jgi:hypothetical protein
MNANLGINDVRELTADELTAICGGMLILSHISMGMSGSGRIHVKKQEETYRQTRRYTGSEFNSRRMP